MSHTVSILRKTVADGASEQDDIIRISECTNKITKIYVTHISNNIVDY